MGQFAIGGNGAGTGVSWKTFIGKLTQSGTSDVVNHTIINDIDGSLTFVRTGITGVYTANIVGAFPTAKTFISPTFLNVNHGSYVNGTGSTPTEETWIVTNENDNTIKIEHWRYDDGAGQKILTDDWTDIPFTLEIRVYP